MNHRTPTWLLTVKWTVWKLMVRFKILYHHVDAVQVHGDFNCKFHFWVDIYIMNVTHYTLTEGKFMSLLDLDQSFVMNARVKLKF